MYHRHPRASGGPGIPSEMPSPLDSRFRGNDGSEAAALINALRRHWPEYLIEALGLGLFMVVAGVCALLLDHPTSPFGERSPTLTSAGP